MCLGQALKMSNTEELQPNYAALCAERHLAPSDYVEKLIMEASFRTLHKDLFLESADEG